MRTRAYAHKIKHQVIKLWAEGQQAHQRQEESIKDSQISLLSKEFKETGNITSWIC